MNFKATKGLKASVGVSFRDILLNSVKLLSFLWFVFFVSFLLTILPFKLMVNASLSRQPLKIMNV